ncbi:MAG: tRNA (adenosine(37)-N6)-threonylcarbamoyltransferase complex dimerization subunit type 1 TsaB [Alphaproteobacteria bacterium CG11_big_fil_rev_8_21_14_0_20_39_49]|nr:MAG: tRNA (adenosine(37)-N6)-threonylcarbamoyltransferase complex dimerization subunit type 1 TsaB [Alphaproteobacteria bacterium CG11_big_fil_rev_8_21_14_0_20_39_49]
MKILSVDTTCGDCSVSLLKDGNIACEITQTESGKQAEQMISLIQTVLKNGGTNYKELDAIAVNIGPGSFTGVRIGLSGVKGINLVTGTPIVPVTSFESVAMQLDLKNNKKDILVALDAKRKQLYVQLFRANLEPLTPPELISYDQITKFNKNNEIILTGNGSMLVADILSANNCNYEVINKNAASESVSIAYAAYKKFKANDYPKIISPLYIRKPDAKKQTP